MRLTIKQFQRKLSTFRKEFEREANRAMVVAGRKSVAVIQKELRDASTREGDFPLIASSRLFSSTSSKRGSKRTNGRRVAARVGVYVPYAQAMEYGTSPHTPPLAPLIEWARVRKAGSIRSEGRLRGGKMSSRQKGGSPKGGERPQRRLSKKASREAERMAYFVQQKISKKGILPRFYMAKSMTGIRRNVVTSLRTRTKMLSKKYPFRFRIRRLS